MNDQSSESDALNAMDGYISWDSNAPPLSDKSAHESNKGNDESSSAQCNDVNQVQYQTPVSLYQSVPIMAARIMNASAPPEEHHVNHVQDELLPTDFNTTLQEIATNLPNTQANLEELSHSQALLTQMFNNNLSPDQDSTNFLRKYTS